VPPNRFLSSWASNALLSPHEPETARHGTRPHNGAFECRLQRRSDQGQPSLSRSRRRPEHRRAGAFGRDDRTGIVAQNPSRLPLKHRRPARTAVKRRCGRWLDPYVPVRRQRPLRSAADESWRDVFETSENGGEQLQPPCGAAGGVERAGKVAGGIDRRRYGSALNVCAWGKTGHIADCSNSRLRTIPGGPRLRGWLNKVRIILLHLE